MVERIRRFTDLPIAVGFGITTRKDVELVWQWAEGAVVGSAIVHFIEENREAPDLPALVGKLVRSLLPDLSRR
jgi:tryptophan synthase alpha chain